MADCLLHLPEDESVVFSGPVTRRLLEEGNGDAALLYLCLLRHRGKVSPGQAGGELRWEESRLRQAEDALRRQQLLGPAVPAEPAEPVPPSYDRRDVTESLEGNDAFRSLTAAVEQKLGKRLSTPDLSILLGLYDYLGLPADVIFLLVGHCVERTVRQYGPGRIPSLRQIEKEGYTWARLGLDTQERAAQYLKQYTRRQGSLPQYMRALGLGERIPAPSEEKFLLGFLEMGFPPETVSLAYDKTMLRCHELKWGYLNGILKNWHAKGLHSVEAVETGDQGKKEAPPPTPGAAVAPTAEQKAAAALRRRMQEKKERDV